MGRNKDIMKNKKTDIVKLLSEGRTTLYLKRDPRTIKKLWGNNEKASKSQKTMNKIISAHQLRHLKKSIAEHHLQNSSTFFAEANNECPTRSTRCRILREIARVNKAKTTPPISEKHKQKRLGFC